LNELEGLFFKLYGELLGCSLSATSSQVKNLSCTCQGLQITTGSGGEVHTILTICSKPNPEYSWVTFPSQVSCEGGRKEKKPFVSL